MYYVLEEVVAEKECLLYREIITDFGPSHGL